MQLPFFRSDSSISNCYRSLLTNSLEKIADLFVFNAENAGNPFRSLNLSQVDVSCGRCSLEREETFFVFLTRNYNSSEALRGTLSSVLSPGIVKNRAIKSLLHRLHHTCVRLPSGFRCRIDHSPLKCTFKFFFAKI